jgi:hypothetical protein
MIALCTPWSDSGQVGVQVDLTYAVGQLNRFVPDAENLLDRYLKDGALKDGGLRYLEYQPATSRDKLVPEDLAVTVLVSSRFDWRAFASVQDCGPKLDLSVLSNKALEHTTELERQSLADLIAKIASWPGLAASVTTKVLHKKRPALIPILDNQSIFGAYMNSKWPQQRARTDSIYAASTIRNALDWIAADLTAPDNAEVWARLQSSQPDRSLVQIFDMVWWAYFRTQEPVKPAPSA